MIIATTDTIAGKEITQTLGMARGSTIQAKHIGKDIMSGLRSIVGGELTEYSEMLEEAREKAVNRMVEDAEKRVNALSEKGVPDSSLSRAKVFLYQAKDAKQRGNVGLAKMSADSMRILIAQAEAQYEDNMNRLKPWIQQQKQHIQQATAHLTGLHKRHADSLMGVIDSFIAMNWLLQADPTLVFASGDFGITRVLNVHKEIDSPYNTYKYPGLPPGPICIPSIASLDAVLNTEDHDYLFFCAKDDLSGYHVFARSITQHNRNARAYRRAIENR